VPQERFEDYGLTGGIASQKTADWLKTQAEATPAKAQQQHEDQKATQSIEAEKQKPQKSNRTNEPRSRNPKRKRQDTAKSEFA
jgi:aspartate/glutamate racemase